RARAFCGAELAAVVLTDGEMLSLAATSGHSEAWRRTYAMYPMPLTDATTLGRTILSKAAVQISDTLADPSYELHWASEIFRSTPAVPMLRGETVIGAIGLSRPVPGDFSPIQFDLLRTFAEQAVIAITSAETYRALQARTSDLQEALEQQTATAEVLEVIN